MKVNENIKKVKEKNLKKIKHDNMQGITLTSLVVTIIILIILAGICINLLLGQNGIVNLAKQAGENYILAEEQEKKDLEDLYSSIMVATNDDAKITISMKDLNTLIENKVKEQLNNVNTSSVPAGTVISYMGNDAPNGYLFCNGATYNISDYPNLAEQIKNEFGSYNYYGGDGTTTFAVPNLQGEFLRGYSTSRTASKTSGISTASVGKHQEATNHSMMGILDNGSGDIWVGGYGNGFASGGSRNQDINGGSSISFVYSKREYTTRNTSANFVGKPTYYTSRPTNTSVLYCIKY